MIIIAKGVLLGYEVCVFDKILQEAHLPFPAKPMKRSLDEIKILTQYIFSLRICYGQNTNGFSDVVYIRGTQLINNAQTTNKEHVPFAFLEKQGQPGEAYRRIDCILVKKLQKTMQQIRQRYLAGINSVKVIHASKDVLAEKVNEQRKIIKLKNETISNIKERLQEKIEKEEIQVSTKIANVVHTVSENIASKNVDISNLHPIFQELIHIQAKKLNGTRYHPMFLRWAISVYSKSGYAAYNAMKTIMRLPSISTLKSYINENEQWFFSHDSFKIQKGLLWSQRENCYVDYLDFEDEMQEYQEFAIQCQHEILKEKNSLSNSISEKQDRKLATQVHQFVWHSITHNFSFPISYYGINNMTAHNLNTLIFSLAAKLECIGIHTIGSICDGAGENRNHIKSFDWYASKWSSGDLVEVNFRKDKKSYHVAEIVDSNFEKIKFTVRQLDWDSFTKITIDRAFIRPQTPLKSEWNINEFCEFKNPKDNQWYLGKITNFDSITSIFTVEIPGSKNKPIEEWQVFNHHISEFLRPVHDIE
ncbi:hypothetical protein GLOIN_2v1762743 [Rhizophagus irregularis DAOM 181602=DAOM 197198]|nr:hypothetical protein GLOIN_2v1762743 [Rhizophagus irregularis DAOM 181602=DAOM 197198]